MSAYLDTSQLQPIGSPTPTGGGGGDSPDYLQRYNSPAGEVISIIGPDGRPKGYQIGGADGQMAVFDASGNYTHSFAPGRGSFWGDFKGNVLSDKKFMTFLAIAGTAGYFGGTPTPAAGAGAAAPITAATPSWTAPTLGQVATGATAVGATSPVWTGEGDTGAPTPDPGNYSDVGSGGYNDSGPWNLPEDSQSGGTTWEQIVDGARRAGQSVLDFVQSNPNLLSAALGAVGGYLANKDDFTSSTTTTTTIDPAQAAYRDMLGGQLANYRSSPSGYTPGSGGTPAPANYGASSMASNSTGWGAAPNLFSTGSNATGKSNLLSATNPGPSLFAGGSAGSAAQYSGQQGSNSTGFGTPAGFAPTPTPWNTPGSNATGFSAPGQQMAPNGQPLSITNQGPMLSGQPAAQAPVFSLPQATPMQQPTGTANGMPDWSGSNGYMNQINSLLGQGTQKLNATANPYATEANPYLNDMIEKGRSDLTGYYDQFIAPKFASGSSFGSSGLGFAEVAERDNQARQFAEMASGLRFNDYNMRSGLAEQGAGRQDELNSGQRNNFLTAGNTFGNFAQNAGQFNANFDINKWKAEQDEEYRKMALLTGYQPPGGSTSTTSTTAQGNPWAGLLAGGIAGANLWNTTKK